MPACKKQSIRGPHVLQLDTNLSARTFPLCPAMHTDVTGMRNDAHKVQGGATLPTKLLSLLFVLLPSSTLTAARTPRSQDQAKARHPTSISNRIEALGLFANLANSECEG